MIRETANLETPLFPLRVNDLKQFEYCPRIVFYNTVMPVERKASVKMERGKESEFRLDSLERRRGLKRYQLDAGERHFHLWLTSERLGLSGRLDLLIVSSQGCFPVDFKHTRGRPYRNHLCQLAGYALLVQERFERQVTTGFIYLSPIQEVVRVSITSGLKQEALKRLAEIRSLIKEAVLPAPTPVRARCQDCEFRNYCGDVF
ncbi:MAG: CRISPR-associated protein Cas4 [Acidobacteriota bacterium]